MEDIPRATFGHVMRGRLEFSYSAPHSTVERFLSAYPGGIDVLPHSARVLLARDFQAAAVAQLVDSVIRTKLELVDGPSARHPNNSPLRAACQGRAIVPRGVLTLGH